MEDIIKEQLRIKTIDGEDIAGTIYEAKNPKDAVLFVHMMPETKESWDTFANLVAIEGHTGLAIDLRGHGDSSGGPKGYTHFTDEEHQKSILDLDAAVKFLLSRGFTYQQITFVGASIGANLALKYMADHGDYPAAVLLSPGTNYHGVLSRISAAEIKPGRNILLVSAKDDGENASDTVAIGEAFLEGVQRAVKIYDTGGHGTTLLKTQPQLQGLIQQFLGKLDNISVA